MRTLIVLILLIGSIARADKKGDKARIDDCFADMASLSRDVNEHIGDDDQWKYNRKLIEKQQRCLALKTTYDKTYGQKPISKGKTK